MTAALSNITKGGFGWQVGIIKERYATKGIYLKGRQILHGIMSQYKMFETGGQLLELRELMSLRLNGDDLRIFINSWDATLLPM